jgi:redox-sensitive bicupin YhaK (pirin superfamily)
MKKTLHKAETRGLADHGWLKSRHTFSFADYYNPDRIKFGLLRVLNDDIVQPGMGFGSHSHDNMEIVSIPLSGELAHKDSMGTKQVIKTGDVQIMSAGSGITHSEFNNSETDIVNFLQIWVFPKKRNITPGYDQKTFNPDDSENRVLKIISPDKNPDTLWINQAAFFSLAKIGKGKSIEYVVNQKGNGLYTFVLEGEVTQAGETLLKRDALGLEEIDNIDISANKDSEILLIEVPMSN